MKINKKLAVQLQKLAEGEDFSYSAFSEKNKKIIKELIEDGLLSDNKIIRRRKVVFCKKPEKLEQHLRLKYEIYGLQNYIKVLLDPNSTKAEMVSVSGDSKLKYSKSLEGFLIKTYKDINGKINNEKINLKTATGTSIHINDWQNFQIDSSATIVVVENSENFRQIHKQKKLFKNINPIFILRFANSTAISKWIKQMDNNYLHFGDFDLKGIHIYITEFKQKIDNPLRCNFLIPENIENIIKKGSSERYYNQEQNLKNFDFSIHKEIFDLVKIIRTHKKGSDQEGLLITNK